MLNLEKQGNTSENPLGWVFFSLQVESPHKGRSSLTSLVHRTGINTSAVLLICWNGLEEHHRHGRSQVLQLCLCNDPSLRYVKRDTLVPEPSQPASLLPEL